MSVVCDSLLLATVLLCAPFVLAQLRVETITPTFTTIDVPGAVITNVLGINTAGDVVGNYSAGSSAPSHGFLYSGGIFTFLDYPGQYTTIAYGINDSGVISGSAFADDASNIVGFLYDQITFTTIGAPGKAATVVYGINSAGNVVGGEGTSLSSTKAFELRGARFKNITPPGTYLYAYGSGINNLGEVVGFTLNGSYANGFSYSGGKFHAINFPGPTLMTLALGVNDSEIVVGSYEGCNPSCADHAFIFMRGKYISFDYPGAVATFADGINASGQIVGSYTLDGTTFHGYVAAPITTVDAQGMDW